MKQVTLGSCKDGQAVKRSRYGVWYTVDVSNKKKNLVADVSRYTYYGLPSKTKVWIKS